MAAVLDSADLDVSAAQKVLVAVVVPELQFPNANNQEKVGMYRKDLYILLPLYYHMQKDCCPSHSPSMCAVHTLSCPVDACCRAHTSGCTAASRQHLHTRDRRVMWPMGQLL